MAAATQEDLIRKLNPMIQVGYSKVDNEIWKAVWHWVIRRHRK